MALAYLGKLLAQAAREGRGCGSFSVGNMEMVKGAVKAAEETDTAIILQVAEARLSTSPLELIGPMMIQAAKEASVDVAVHFDHGRTVENIKKALDLGFTSVMLDASDCPLEENIEKTAEVVRLAEKYGAAVEAELGVVGGSEGGSTDRGIRFTDPKEAAEFVSRTGVNALAVAIGNAHGKYRAAPRLAFDVLEKIHQQVEIPLVMHGGSGISDRDFQRAISLGVRKVNIATASFDSLTNAAGRYLTTDQPHDFFGLSRAMEQGTYENVKHHIEVFNMTI